MTAAEKAAKAKEILNSHPSDDDLLIAVGLAKQSAEENDPEGLYLMGQMHYRGIGVEEDDEESYFYSQKALEAGCRKAKAILAAHCILGNVVPRDIPLAEQYLRDCMAENDTCAYCLMGDFVFQKVFPDIEWASFADYFKKAFDLGEPTAMLHLAERYNFLCEPEQADYWYQQASAAGVPGVEESKAKFTEENYQERRQNIINFYTNTGMYDKVIALVNRDLAAGDDSARWPKAMVYAQGLGNEAYGRDLPRALNLYEKLAEEGEPHADFMLGLLYYSAEELNNPQKSLRYIQKAADEGHPNAMFVLATNYLNDPETRTNPDYDFGLEKDEALGMELLQKAAEGDDPNALFSLHLCYSLGKHLEQDDKKAFELLERSNNLDVTPEKVSLLGEMYEFGRGVELDYEKAATYCQWATLNGDVHAAYHLAMMYRCGIGVEPDEEKADILVNRAHELQRWQEYGIIPLTAALAEAEKGDPAAMFQLGNRYHQGDGVEQDMEKAVEWWKKASDKGEIPATHNLGVYYQTIDDIPNAKKYLEISVSAGYIDSYFNLALCYLRHAAEGDNVQKGIDLLEEAAEKGHTDSQWRLFGIYYDGTVVTKDFDKARYWLEKCLETDYPKAHYAMAASLAQGTLYPEDLDKALEHWRKAVELGCHDADEGYINLRWYGNGAEKNRLDSIFGK